ncbi:MAG: DNA polymerase/3'-5' exonuclease PolX, partial [Polyangiaceae bacterium]|nr:DNA polymerase/3'-5' exonuclease PolX [Polyangiaceae bacterium]
MEEMSREQVAAVLREISRYVWVSDPRSFRARSYEQAALAIESTAIFEELLRAGRLTELPGIGESIAGVIEEIHRTGESRLLERLRAEVPRGVVEIAAIRGIDAARARKLHDALGVESIEALEEACRDGRIEAIKGYGPRTARGLLKKIAEHRQRWNRAVIGDVIDDARALELFASEASATVAVSLAGDVRRWVEVVDAIDLVLASNASETSLARLLEHPRIAAPNAGLGPTDLELTFAGAPPLRITIVPPERFGWALLRRSAAPAHVDALLQRARSKGVDLETLDAPTEADIYERLGLPFLPAEVREGDDELTLAANGDDFADLVTVDDIRGAVHCHTTHSDGRASIEDMAKAAATLGLEYLTITDHSATAHYAGGLDSERLDTQRTEIEHVKRLGIGVDVLAGTESDILPDGSLDFPTEALRRLDVVIASIHARNAQDDNAMTERLVRCMNVPVRKIWGHPLGRLLLLRDPIACRIDEVLDAAVESGTIIEVNGDPRRLDLPPSVLGNARRRGLRFVASSDAHSERGIAMFRNAVAMARRGGLRKKHVLNTLAV